MNYCTIVYAFCLSVALIVGCKPTESPAKSAASEATEPKPSTLVESGYDADEMDAAIAKSRREVETFISALSDPACSDFAVKAPITDGEKIEHFWLIDVSYRNGEFEGEINNDPGMVKNVKLGQRWTLKKEEISDWLYFKGGKMHGNYTVRPLLKTMSEEEAESIRAMLAKP